MSGTAFSSGDDVIQRRLDLPTSAVKIDYLNDFFEIDRSVSWITGGGFKKVALQFPDELLINATSIASQIQARVKDSLIFILGDTSYGSCCVDEVGAQHYSADCIIHFGHSCLSPTGRFPVLYVFGTLEINIEDCVHHLKELCSDPDMKTVLVYDTVFSYSIDEIYSKLQHTFTNMLLSRLCVPSHDHTSTMDQNVRSSFSQHSPIANYTNESLISQIQVHPHEQTVSSSSSCICYCGRVIELLSGEDINSYSFIYIGEPEGSTLKNLMMKFSRCPFYSYNPQRKHCRKETVNVNKALMKRYYLIERAKDANIVGIVVGTLGVNKYRNVIEHLKCVLKKAGKKSYTFVVGKLNPAKLANFAEVDIYALVACPESTLLDQTEFYRPIVSPLEMEIACNQAREWTGEYSTDFRDILPGSSMHVESQDFTVSDDSRTDVSLISNRVRVLGIKDSPAVSAIPSQDLVLRSEAMTVLSVAENAGEYLSGRTWKGLEQKLGETPVTKAVEGQYGIAASYQHELGSS